MAIDAPRFLLLLPPAPSPPDKSSLKSAFGEAISQVLKEAATQSSESPKATVLEIALACPHLVNKAGTPRSSLYAETQSLVAGVYRLVCSIAARENINVEDADGVDVRVLLLAWSPEEDAGDSSARSYPCGAVISLESLAKSGRPWRFAFGAESSAGEALVKAFLAAKGSTEEVVRLQSGTDQSSQGSPAKQPQTKTTQAAGQSTGNHHHHVAVGGTFDHIHIGHKLLLTMTVFAVDDDGDASNHERSATIGITGDQLLVNKKHREVLESWQDRYKAVMTFINAIIDFSAPSSSGGQRHVSIRDDLGPNGKSMDVHYPTGLVIKCTEIQDAFGPTITDEQISALIISAETRAGGKAVNDKRGEKGWHTLEVLEVDVLDAADDGGAGIGAVEGFESKLSSTAIREKIAKKRQSSL